MGENIGKTISKSLSSKYSQRLLDHAKQSATVALQKEISSERVIRKTAETTGMIIKLLTKSQKPKKIHKKII